VSPIANHLSARTKRKAAKDKIKGKLAQAKEENSTQVVFNEQELDLLNASQKDNTWTDEYVVVSIFSIFNIIVLGGLASAFGFTEPLEGITVAINTLKATGVHVSLLMEVAAGSALGFSVVRRFQ
jgi:hypothetical protein